MVNASEWSKAARKVSSMAVQGFRLSELKGLELAVAKRLINNGNLSSTPLRSGDTLVNRK